MSHLLPTWKKKIIYFPWGRKVKTYFRLSSADEFIIVGRFRNWLENVLISMNKRSALTRCGTYWMNNNDADGTHYLVSWQSTQDVGVHPWSWICSNLPVKNRFFQPIKYLEGKQCCLVDCLLQIKRLFPTETNSEMHRITVMNAAVWNKSSKRGVLAKSIDVRWLVRIRADKWRESQRK